MFTEQENAILTRVGPGTLMGELFRRFWIPFLLPDQLAGPDHPPVRVKLLGEELVAFRDTNGRIGLVDRYCAHRQVDLFFGRSEEGGLRCIYHGWKYDVEGNCLDMPAEPADSAFKQKVKLKSYPVREFGGVLWTCMGPSGMSPELPQLEWAIVPPSHRLIGAHIRECNWAQALEGDVDDSHVAFLHSWIDQEAFAELQRSSSVRRQFADAYTFSDRAPQIRVEQVPYGLLVGFRRNAEDAYWWKLQPFPLPFHTIAPAGSEGFKTGHSWVPIDDEHTLVLTQSWHAERAPTNTEFQELADPRGVHPELIPGTLRPKANKDNDYLLDRQFQRSGNFTGIRGVVAQDLVATESPGAVLDRTRERLGVSDTAVIAFRRLMLKLARDLQEGSEPYATAHGEVYRVRPVNLMVRRDMSEEEWSRRVRDEMACPV